MKYAALLGALLIALALARGEARAWELGEHQHLITQPLLAEDLRWSNKAAIDRVINCNLATDLADMSEKERNRVGKLYPASKNQVPAVQDIVETAWFNRYPFEGDNFDPLPNVATHGFHFDNLFSLAENTTRWTDLSAWVTTRGAAAQANWDADNWLCTMGITFHAVQDFYTHTNWVVLASVNGAAKSLDPGSLPCWEEHFGTEAAAWRTLHPAFDHAAFTTSLSSDSVNVLEFAPDPPRPPKKGLQAGNWPNGTKRESAGNIVPWGHRHPGIRGFFPRVEDDRAAIRAVYASETAPVDEYNAAIALSRRCSYSWAGSLMSNETLGMRAADLHELVETSSSSVDPPTEDALGVSNLHDVIVELTGFLGEVEHVNFAVGGEAATALIIEHDRPYKGSIDEAFPDPTLLAWAADDTIWDTLLEASDARALARQYAADGLLILSRSPESVGGTTELLTGGSTAHASGDGSGTFATSYALIVGAIAAAAALAAAAGGWYTRRRWMR